MPKFQFESFHVYELIAGAPDHFVLSIISTHYVRQSEIEFVTIIPLRDDTISPQDPLRVKIDPRRNPDLNIPRSLHAFVDVVQSLPERIFVRRDYGKISETEILEIRQKLGGWLAL